MPGGGMQTDPHRLHPMIPKRHSAQSPAAVHPAAGRGGHPFGKLSWFAVAFPLAWALGSGRAAAQGDSSVPRITSGPLPWSHSWVGSPTGFP